jgi:hypothetical protein
MASCSTYATRGSAASLAAAAAVRLAEKPRIVLVNVRPSLAPCRPDRSFAALATPPVARTAAVSLSATTYLPGIGVAPRGVSTVPVWAGAATAGAAARAAVIAVAASTVGPKNFISRLAGAMLTGGASWRFAACGASSVHR